MLAGQNDRPPTNQLIKVLSSSALIICIARLGFAIIFAFMHLWGLVSCAFLGALIWLWIQRSSKMGFHTLPFILGIIESVFFCVYTIASLGWNCGTYFSLILLLPLVLINERISLKGRIFFCFLITLALVSLYIASLVLDLDRFTGSSSQNLLFFLNLVEGCVILILITYRFETEKMSSEAEIVNANKHLMTLANTDPLTNLMNRRNMLTCIEEEKDKVDRGGKSFSLIMIDVDNFKQINDEFGHDGGDFVLVILAEKIRLAVRKNDLVSRWGGDEFLIMLAETDLHNSQGVAEKIRSRVVNSPFVYREMDIPVTITLGLSLCDRENGIGSCIRKADMALYKGKQLGKNRSVRG